MMLPSSLPFPFPLPLFLAGLAGAGADGAGACLRGRGSRRGGAAPIRLLGGAGNGSVRTRGWVMKFENIGPAIMYPSMPW